MPVRAYYSEAVSFFLADPDERIFGVLAGQHEHALEEQQRYAWIEQISILKRALLHRSQDRLLFEFQIPRMGKRADAVLLCGNVAIVIEFKIGAAGHAHEALQQVEDYALDLKNFHEGSHHAAIVPVLVSSAAESGRLGKLSFAQDRVASPLGTNASGLADLIQHLQDVSAATAQPSIDQSEWTAKGYRPTPTIVEAAQVLYRTHRVEDISRSDAGAQNLRQTSVAISRIIDQARKKRLKTICFVTGVPGSGKTLAGLNLATTRFEEKADEHAVFLSGNGPLVAVLQEALARDKSSRDRIPKKMAKREVSAFVQNIHHFRDEYVADDAIPLEKVVIFDEAQRAWNRQQAAKFMQRKRGRADFNLSEPEFLISVMDRHEDWCTVVCLVGGGQEINTGEAGMAEWMRALEDRFSDWLVFVSPRITLPEYASPENGERFLALPRVHSDECLHLAVSLRSFRAEALSSFVGYVLDNRPGEARAAYQSIAAEYPIYVTRDLAIARQWLLHAARGSERIGLVASSGAQRLRPEGIHIRAEIDEATWFLNERSDVRSSYYLEEVATEFSVQGLELDWVGVCWDGDYRYIDGDWSYHSFKGTRWLSIRDEVRRVFLKNAYRVLLTRARQGMILFVPHGSGSDPTRHASYYDGTAEFLISCGVPLLEGDLGPRS